MPELTLRRARRVPGRATRDAIALAKEICAGCPVFADCEAYYTANPDRWMITAGRTPAEWNELRSRSPRPSRRPYSSAARGARVS